MTDITDLITEDADATRAAREQMTVEELDKSNEERLGRIVAMRIMPPPGLFENLRQIAYMDAILEKLDIAQPAKHNYAVMAANVLDAMEAQIRQQKIMGGPQAPVDLAVVQDIHSQTKRNREQRRHDSPQ